MQINNFIGSITDISMDTVSTKKHGNKMTQAIKDFKDEYFTGLTDSKRKEIEKKIKDYINQYDDPKKINPEDLRNFIRHLLFQYGFKGNINEMITGLLSDCTSSTDDTLQTAYNLNNQSSLAKRLDLTSSSHLKRSAW